MILDVRLGMIGIDYSRLELCPIPVENEESNNRERRN